MARFIQVVTTEGENFALNVDYIVSIEPNITDEHTVLSLQSSEGGEVKEQRYDVMGTYLDMLARLNSPAFSR